jgi:acyl carrier protein
VPGELCIAGAALARGYLNRPELTAERFITLSGGPLGLDRDDLVRLYRTGDLARWLSDGTLEYLGRTDDQVKLRGYRIELGEIEAVLGEHQAVRQAAVSLYTADDDPRLVAYIVPAGGAADMPAALRGWLKERLPEYMVPSHFVALDALPLTPSGKLDRRGLPPPSPVREDRGGVTVPPRTPVEKRLAGIWAEVLGVDRIGVRDDFFALGGHSLRATQVISRLRQAFAIDLPLRALFEAPVLEDLAAVVEKAHREAGERPTGDVPPLTRASRPRGGAESL